MRRFLAVAAVVVGAAGPIRAASSPATLRFGRFDDVRVLKASGTATSIAILVSGDDGWAAPVPEIAAALSGRGALVLGVDGATYLSSLRAPSKGCLSPAGDLGELSRFAQKRLGTAFESPILVGYGSGATLVYAALAQAPPSTFRGAISVGFRPEMALPQPFCRGSGLTSRRLKNGAVRVDPATALEVPWIALEGTPQIAGDADTVDRFVKHVVHGDVVLGSTASWKPRLEDAYGRLAESGEVNAVPLSDVKDLPLVVLPSTADPSAPLAILVSGDGGWANIDRSLSRALVASGVPVVGLNSLKYFWRRRTPDEAGEDLARLLRAYLPAWQRRDAVLIGYSRGADVLPFMASRLPPDLRSRVRLLAFLGLENEIEFEIHVSALWNSGGKSTYIVRPEMEALRGTPMICFYGADEADTLCPALPDDLISKVKMKGGHHFGGDYGAIARAIRARLH